MTVLSLRSRRGLAALAVLLSAGLAGCASAGASLGFSIPVGPNAGIGISVDSSGRIGTGVGVSVGGGAVGAQIGVGGSARLPAGRVSTNPYPE